MSGENRAKRLILLTKFYIVIFILSLLAFLNRWDSIELGKDIRALDVLQSVNQLEISPNFDNGQIHLLTLNWLKQSNPSLWQTHTSARDALVQLLRAHGVSEEVIAAGKGVTDDGESHFSLIEMTMDESLRTDWRSDIATLTVHELIDRFLLITESKTMSAAVELESKELPNYTATIGEDGGAFAQIKRVSLQGNKAIVNIVGEISPMAQQGPPEATDELAMTVEPFLGPSFFDLLGTRNRAGQNDGAEVIALRENSVALERLRQIYGNLKLTLAQSVSAEDFTRAYRSINLFGFTVSTRRFPYAILLVLLFTTWGIARSVPPPSPDSPRILSQVQDSDLVAMLLSLPGIRAVLWAIVPLASIGLSLPSYHLSTSEWLILSVSGVVIAFWDIYTVWRARNL